MLYTKSTTGRGMLLVNLQNELVKTEVFSQYRCICSHPLLQLQIYFEVFPPVELDDG